MPLNLISGPTGSGKTRLVLERIAPFATAQAGLCIVPSDAAAFELRRQYLSGKKAVLGEIFLSYNHFIKKVADATVPVMSQSEQVLLLYKLLSQKPLTYFKSPSIGIARQAAQAITTLKKNFIGPAELGRMLSARKAERERDLLTLFERYENEKEKHCLLDEGDLTILAAKKIEKSPALDGIELIAFDEFHHFSPGQLHLLDLLGKSRDVLVSFPTTDHNDDLFAPYLEKTLTALKKLTSKTLTIESDAEKSAPKIRNVVLRSPHQETRFVVREILKAVDGKIPPSEIAVCVRRSDYKTLDILSELERCGLASKTHHAGTPLSSPILNDALSGPLTRSLPDSATIEEFSTDVLSALKKMHDEAGLEPVTRGSVARSVNSLDDAEQILKSLATSSKILNLERISRESFLYIFYNQCLSFFASSTELSQITPINIINFEDGGSFVPKLLFIPQMTEGNIPSSFSEHLFFASELGEKFADIFPSPSDMLAEEANLFHRLLTKTSGEVVLSYPAISHSGDESAPSSFLDPYGKAEPVDVPHPPLKADPKLKERIKRVVSIERERMTGDFAHPEYNGRLADKDVCAMIKKRYCENAISPSQIEIYANCPFRFFVERVLNLKPPEEITPEILPKDLGTIVHAILERFYKDHLDLFKKTVADQKNMSSLERTLDKIVDEVFEMKAMLIGYVVDGLKPYEQKIARTLALQVITNEINTARSLPLPLFPTECEWTFGDTPETTLRLKMESGPDALIRGRVDRVDTSDDKSCFTVVDYKTGRQAKSVANDIKNGVHVQLPLYVEAVRRFLYPKSLPLGGILFAVRQPDTKHGFLKKSFNSVHYAIGTRSKSIMDDDAWKEALDGALRAAGQHVASIRDADFSVKPKKCQQYCDYEDVCRYSGKSPDEGSAQGD